MSVRQARRFRKTLTEAEGRLWSELRNRLLLGFKFRRQHPVGKRVFDFYCEEAKLAVELDGSGHSYDLKREEDLDREIEAYEKGIRIVRFGNDEILEDMAAVLNQIIYAIDPRKIVMGRTTLTSVFSLMERKTATRPRAVPFFF